MADRALVQERYAPDQFRILVTCVFLNRTRGEIAEPYITSFFEEYPTVESVRDAEPQELLRRYFRPLGLYRRAWSVVNLAHAFLEDPPMPMVLRCKIGQFDSHLSEVAHLPGVGGYASDAWRLFCRKDFYAAEGITIGEQWRSLRPSDRILSRYVQRKRIEAAAPPVTSPADTLASQLDSLQISRDPPSPLEGGFTVGSGESKLFVSRRVLRAAKSIDDPQP